MPWRLSNRAQEVERPSHGSGRITVHPEIGALRAVPSVIGGWSGRRVEDGAVQGRPGDSKAGGYIGETSRNGNLRTLRSPVPLCGNCKRPDRLSTAGTSELFPTNLVYTARLIVTRVDCLFHVSPPVDSTPLAFFDDGAPRQLRNPHLWENLRLARGWRAA